MSDAFYKSSFFSVIQRSCMMETNHSSYWCIVSVSASHQYCFCI